MIYLKYIKGGLDWFFAFFLVIILLPFFLCTCLLLLIIQGRPLFFIQARSGKNMRKFRLVKFRTLLSSENSELDIKGKKMTFFGRFMRNTGIDEIPQIYNIIKGEMSFVGPRPMPVEYEKLYGEEHKHRFLVKPGLTGLAQISGKNNITWGKRFDLDNWYVRNVSLLLDIKILFRTIIQFLTALFRPKFGGEEMPVFDGSNLN